MDDAAGTDSTILSRCPTPTFGAPHPQPQPIPLLPTAVTQQVLTTSGRGRGGREWRGKGEMRHAQ